MKDDDEDTVAVVEGVMNKNGVMCASSFVYDSASRILFCFEEEVGVREERMDENRATKEKSCRARERIRPRARSETEVRSPITRWRVSRILYVAVQVREADNGVSVIYQRG